MRVAVCRSPSLLALAICSSMAILSSRAEAQQAAAAAPPAPYATEPAAAPPIIRPYALIKPTAIVSSGPLESFGQPNASAATAAGNPVLTAVSDEALVTFQAAQARLGFWFNDKAPVRGQFEFDFIDFTKSSPTTGAVPRLRIAKVEWQLTDSLLLAAGQDWDLFQPVNPHSFNIVSVAFQAGNTAFMRQQAKFLYQTSDLELGVAVGLAGINNAAKASIPEYGRVPTLAARAALLFGAAGRVGISAIGTSWRFAPDQPTERKAFAGGAGVYGDVTPVAGFNLRFEAYGGSNLANLGALSLGNGNATTEDISEIGAVVSARYNMSDAHALYVLAGRAQVLNDEDVIPAYVYPATMGDAPPAASTATIAGVGPGMAWNNTARLGYEYRHDKMIAVVLEGFAFQSKHVLNAAIDGERFDDVQTAVGGELGLLFTL